MRTIFLGAAGRPKAANAQSKRKTTREKFTATVDPGFRKDALRKSLTPGPAGFFSLREVGLAKRVLPRVRSSSGFMMRLRFGPANPYADRAENSGEQNGDGTKDCFPWSQRTGTFEKDGQRKSNQQNVRGKEIPARDQRFPGGLFERTFRCGRLRFGKDVLLTTRAPQKRANAGRGVWL